eukprot:CAMPEP_0173188196 /NCGR_PEP_ID=MMETSP1141-20130122/11130_1 /TAXON_ID=483371 /ORGANISM="non described non described, Strain CCMP2298" /LENGTH=39 /DNA_ID= /DNA_START= /DNA_END= /DNA_ORIENTATION=
MASSTIFLLLSFLPPSFASKHFRGMWASAWHSRHVSAEQ